MIVVDWIAFGEQVHNARRRVGISQDALALKLGMSRNYISLIERGSIGDPGYMMVLRFCHYLGIDTPGATETTPRKPGPK